MSALGQKRTSSPVEGTSALLPKADIAERHQHFRFVPKADSCAAAIAGSSARAVRDMLEPVANCAVQLCEYVCMQIAASGFDQVRSCYAPRLGFPNTVLSKMLSRVLVHRGVDVLHDPRLQEVESMIGHRCAP